MAKTRKKHFNLNSDTFAFDVPVFIGWENAEIETQLKRWKLPEPKRKEFMNQLSQGYDDGKYIAFHIMISTGEQMICFHSDFFSFKLSKSISLSTHEIFHAVAGRLRFIGLNLGAESEEAYAYLIDSLVKQFWTKIHMK